MSQEKVEPVEFHVWGCRGSHNIVPARSGVGNATSCYSLLQGRDLFVFDAGRGLQMLSHVTAVNPGFRGLERIHILVTHAHTDHWEGLKDADWFWKRDNGLAVTIYGTLEALSSIRRGFAHPTYVPLEILARGAVDSLRHRVVRAGTTRRIGPFRVETVKLNHYSRDGRGRRYLDAIGYVVSAPGGPRFAYLSDHEPSKATREVEEQALDGTHLAVYDSHYRHLREHMYGHGSQEHASAMARNHPRTTVLAGHLGPMYSDKEILAAYDQYSRGAANFFLAGEGARYRWSVPQGRFERLRDSWLQ